MFSVCLDLLCTSAPFYLFLARTVWRRRETWQLAEHWLHSFSSPAAFPPIRNAVSGPSLAVFVIVLGEANLTLTTLLRRFEVLNGLIIVAGYSLLWLLFQSSALLLSLCGGSI